MDQCGKNHGQWGYNDCEQDEEAGIVCQPSMCIAHYDNNDKFVVYYFSSLYFAINHSLTHLFMRECVMRRLMVNSTDLF